MAQGTEKLYKNFVQGLITEASALTFPENASLDEDNFVLERDGSRSRRKGVDYEQGFALKATGLSAALLEAGRQSFHVWEFPGGDLDRTAGVVRINNKLFFMNLQTSNPSNNFLNSGNAITISGLDQSEIECISINNKLVIVGADLENPILLTYDKAADSVSQSEITVKVRDFWGVEDNLEVSERPVVLSTEHHYNLINQGWNDRVQTGTAGEYVAQRLFNDKGFFPSNSDTWILGKNEDVTDTAAGQFDSNFFERNSTDFGFAAQGSIILDIFNRGTDRESGSSLTPLPADKEEGNFSTAASYAGRMFYSGVNSEITDSDERSPNFSGYVFFSQVLASDKEFGECFQEADPTSDNISDLVDTDGGTIKIPEASQIIKLVPAKSSLLVFSENGVWEIFGDTGGFIATSFQVAKISSNGINNARSVVEVNGDVIYWSKAGIYLLDSDAVSSRFKAQNISLISIQQHYLDIPDLGKKHAKGMYDEKENRVRWLYNDTDSYSETSFVNKYNKELVFDLTLRAFYPQTISSLDSSSPYISDYIQTPEFSITEAASNVQIAAGSDNVVVGAGADQVVVSTSSIASGGDDFRFLTMHTTNFTVSQYKETTFVDWKTAGSGTGKNYESFLVTGYELFNDTMREKSVPYIWFYFTRTEDGFTASGTDFILDNQSSCKVQAQWQWANHVNSGKWGTVFEAYRLNRLYTPTGASDDFNYGESVIVTKNKLRGSGKSLSLYISSDTGKDMKLLGWAVQAVAQSKG